MIQQIWRIGLIACFSFCVQYAVAQTVQTTVDRQDILIGEQFKYNIKASFPAGALNIQWFNIPDSIGHFEVVDKSKVDTATTNNNIILTQTITYTSFDSGRWNTPALQVGFTPAGSSAPARLFTDSIPINIGYSPADSTGQLRDIKPILDVHIVSYFWYYVAGGILLLLIAGYFIWRYIKNRQQQSLPEFSGKASAYEEAMQALEKLKQLNLQDAADMKKYHEQLSQIFKWFITRKLRVSIMNKTTGDILVLLAENNLPKETISNTAAALRTGDAAKFAKYQPTAVESETSLQQIKAAISFIANPKPATT